MAHRISWLDVFAERPLAGNALAVIDDADDLSDEQMLALARETRLSETTFVQSAGADGADYRNRIFTVESEIPFAGHPSLGTAVAVARWRGLEEASFVQETEAGLQPVAVRSDGERWRADMVQNEPEFGTRIDPAAAMAAVRLEAADAHRDLPARIVSTGLPTAIVPVADPAALARAAPDFDAIDEVLRDARPRAGETPTFYLVWIDLEAGTARARMFSAAVPGGEDPATGSAGGPLGAYAAERGTERLAITQGDEMGRVGLIEVEMWDGRPRVGGAVIPVLDGDLSAP